MTAVTKTASDPFTRQHFEGSPARDRDAEHAESEAPEQHETERCLDVIGGVQRDLLERRGRDDYAGDDRHVRPRVDVPRKLPERGSLDRLGRGVRAQDPGGRSSPTTASPRRRRTRRARRRCGRQPLSGVERHDDGQADRNDHLAERDDDDECVTLGEVARSHGPVSASGVDHRPDHDGCARKPDDDATVAADEGAGEQNDEGHRR